MIIRMENAEGLSSADGSPAGNQPGGAVRRKREKGDLRVGGTGAGAARVRDAREKDAGGGAGIPGEDDGEVAAADHPSGATVPGDGAGAGADLPAAQICPGVYGGGRALAGERGRAAGAGADLPAAQICPGVYGGGRALAGEGGSGARAAERTGHAADPGTEGRGVRPPGICAADADLGGALVQSAKETGLSETGSALRSYTRRPCKCSKLGLARWRVTSRCQTTAWRIRVWRWRRTPAASMPHSIARPSSSTTWRQAWWHPPGRPRGL